MISRLIFVRHGQSETNVEHVYAGARSEVRLTAHGRAQARTAAKLLRHDEIDQIIASDYDRARETASIIAEGVGYAADAIVYDSRLREFNVGKLTGQPDNGFTAYLEYLASGVDPSAETVEAVEDRLRPLLNELRSSTGTVLVVAHAGIGRVLRVLLSGVPIEDIARLDVPNAHPFELPLKRLTEGELA